MTENQAKNDYQRANANKKKEMYPLAIQALALTPHLTNEATTPKELAELIDKVAEAIWMEAEPEF